MLMADCGTTNNLIKESSHLAIASRKRKQEQDNNSSVFLPSLLCSRCFMPLEPSSISFGVGDELWHASCLRCDVCHSDLSQENSCFRRGDRIYCPSDYHMLFPKPQNPSIQSFISTASNHISASGDSLRSCTTCQRTLHPHDLVLQSRKGMFHHVTCFQCSICGLNLHTGMLYLLDTRSRIFCQQHFHLANTIDKDATNRNPSYSYSQTLSSTKNPSFSSMISSQHPTLCSGDPFLNQQINSNQDTKINVTEKDSWLSNPLSPSLTVETKSAFLWREEFAGYLEDCSPNSPTHNDEQGQGMNILCPSATAVSDLSSSSCNSLKPFSSPHNSYSITPAKLEMLSHSSLHNHKNEQSLESLTFSEELSPNKDNMNSSKHTADDCQTSVKMHRAKRSVDNRNGSLSDVMADNEDAQLSEEYDEEIGSSPTTETHKLSGGEESELGNRDGTASSVTSQGMTDKKCWDGFEGEGNLKNSSSNVSNSDGNHASHPSSNTATAQQRQKRIRTSFKHHQLRSMKAYFTMNHNPDAKDLKRLSQDTGLSKRVLQVWFQNARAKFRRTVQKQTDVGSCGGLNQDMHNDVSNPVLKDMTHGGLSMNDPNSCNGPGGLSRSLLQDMYLNMDISSERNSSLVGHLTMGGDVSEADMSMRTSGVVGLSSPPVNLGPSLSQNPGLGMMEHMWSNQFRGFSPPLPTPVSAHEHLFYPPMSNNFIEEFRSNGNTPCPMGPVSGSGNCHLNLLSSSTIIQPSNGSSVYGLVANDKCHVWETGIPAGARR